MKATQKSTPSRRQARAAPAPVGTGRRPRTFDDLSFTARDARGHMVWWCVVPPTTNFWPDHFQLGRSLAQEALELIRDPDLEPGHDGAIGFILGDIAEWLPTVAGSAAVGIAQGFFAVISEALSTGATLPARTPT